MTLLHPKNMLILAVDDDRDDLDLFCEAVRDLDPTIHVVTALNGEDALALLHQVGYVQPDLIFLDVNMPMLDGRACLKAIREEKQTKDLTVIMYSTSVSDEDKKLFEQMQAKFFVKPSSYEQFILLLHQIFSEL